MKYFWIALLVIIGLGIGVFIGLGGIAGVEWVVFIVLFPLIYIFGTIILGKRTDDDEEVEKEVKKSRWDKYE